MIEQPKLILIGGTKRNIGKTTLATHLISKYAPFYSVIGLKVTSIYPNDHSHHGTHEIPLTNNFEIIEETDRSGRKDTSKMLLAGADKVYYIRTIDESIELAYREFQKNIHPDSLIVCESISLRKHILPGAFVLIKYALPHDVKTSALQMESYADKIIYSDGEKYNENIDQIIFNGNKWGFTQS